MLIKFGVKSSESATEDTILVRGASADVDWAISEILQIVENAKNDEIMNSYVSTNPLMIYVHLSIGYSQLNSKSAANTLAVLLVLRVLV